MVHNKLNRTGLGIALVGLTLAASTVAFAQGNDGDRRCAGEQSAKTPEERAQRAAERFQKADKNNDGFLTKDEVGDKRWEHIKVADTNNDGKVSKAELEQAHKDGKLGHHEHKSQS
jgi:Ca2+-binding EF-hand superfamily protein